MERLTQKIKNTKKEDLKPDPHPWKNGKSRLFSMTAAKAPPLTVTLLDHAIRKKTSYIFPRFISPQIFLSVEG